MLASCKFRNLLVNYYHIKSHVHSKSHSFVIPFRNLSTPAADSRSDSKPNWTDVVNQKKWIQYASQQLQINDMSDWYKVTVKDLQQIGGLSIIKKYNYSTFQLLSALFPDYEWLPWKFTQSPRNFWSDIKNHKRFIEWAAKQFKIKEMSDWYNISVKDFHDIGGSSVLTNYNGSPSQMLAEMYPEYDWLPWKFTRAPRNCWDDMKVQRKFVECLGNELGIKDMSDWYKVSQKEFYERGGTHLLHLYNDSPSRLLSAVYPEYDWLPWKFSKAPGRFWQDDKNTKKFVDWAGKELGIKEMSDWYKVSIKDIRRLCGDNEMSLPQLLSTAYPDFNWEFNLKSKSNFYKKTQFLLKSMLKSIFPQDEVLEDYRHPDIVASGLPLEIDYFYPNLNLAIEYQGQQHFKDSPLFHRQASTVEENKQRDIQKSILCKEKGITLVEIPYWWDRNYESLLATIYSQRPDLFKERPSGTPIPLSRPVTNSDNKIKNSSIQQQVLMSASVWDESMDPNGWWMSEKYDGIRLYWDGSQFFSRQGNKVKVPKSLSSLFPPVPLDGELWTQYGLFQEAVSLSQSRDEESWKKATFWVFDAPELKDKMFEERIEFLKQLKEEGKLPSFVKLVEFVKCEGNEHLKKYFNGIAAKGGEGVMLREPQSMYKPGRSKSLRKFKPFFDTEVKVIQNNYPHGFNCVQINGKSIFVGLSDNYEEAKRVKEGSVITVKHSGANTYGTLQYPKFYRERSDVQWEDLIKHNS